MFVTAGPKVNWYRHFDNNRYTFLVTGANSFNSSGGTQVNAVDRGAGVVVEWDVFDSVELSVGYLAEATEFLTNPSNSSSDASRGLFGGTNTLTAQIEVYPTDNLNLRFLFICFCSQTAAIKKRFDSTFITYGSTKSLSNLETSPCTFSFNGEYCVSF